MAQIRLRQVQELTTDPISGRRLRASNPDDSIGSSLKNLGGALGAFAEAEDRLAEARDEAAAKELDVAYQKHESEVLRTGENAYLTLRGKNALEAKEDTYKSLEDKRTELLNATTSPRQRKMLEGILEQRLIRGGELIGTHMAGETLRYQREQSLSRIAMSKEAGRGAVGDPTEMERQRQTGISEMRAMAKRDGWAPEALKFGLEEYNSTFYAAVVGDISTRSPMQAKAFLDAHKDKMRKSDITKLNEALKAPINEEWADAKADEMRGISAGEPENSAREGNLSAQLARVDGMRLSREREEALKQALIKKHNLDTTLLRQEETAAQRRADEYVEQLGQNFVSLSQLPPQVRARMSASQRMSYAKLAEANTKGDDKFETDWSVYTDLAEKAAKGEEFNPYEYRTLLSDTEFKEVVRWNKSNANGDELNLTTTTTLNKKMTLQLQALGLDESKKKDRARAWEFRRNVQDEINAQEKDLGRKLTPQEQDAVIDTMTLQLPRRRAGFPWFGQSKIALGVATGKDKIIIPENQRSLVIEALATKNIPATEENIRALYLDTLQYYGGTWPE